jgi:hypothetical protein
MQDITHAEYVAALKTLGPSKCIANFTLEQLITVCPHLTEEQVSKSLSGDYANIALPPIQVRGAFQLLYYTPASRRMERYVAIGLSSGRTRASYRRKKDSYSGSDALYIDEATAYAHERWPDQLIIDDWRAYMTVCLQDPSDLNDLGWPANKTEFSVCLDRAVDEIDNPGSRLSWQVWNDAIIRITSNSYQRLELQGDRGESLVYNCARCGSGLGLTGCRRCGLEFNDDSYRHGWDTPLPPKAVRFLRDSGYTFALDPDPLARS